MAFMRMMGRESVDYHRATIAERGDDYPGRALVYYASRGETPLVWGGGGASRLGLVGPVTPDSYEAIFGPGGACRPDNGDRLVLTRRPGMELVISAHKSVAELGVIGRAEDMHRIMDAERDATMDYLDRVTRHTGGRRGRTAAATATGGLIYAHTRHATSRAGDPCPHDHVLIANLVEMLDEQGGWKAADTALWREHLHAATMIGRAAAARAAVELGYAIEADPGPSGRLGHWRIAGVPDEVIKLHSKRSAQITAECEARGETGYRARSVAARTTRTAKQDEGVEADLVRRWQAELAGIGWPAERLAEVIDTASARSKLVDGLDVKAARELLSEVLGEDSDLARKKVFFRRDVIVALAPHLYGQDPRLVEALADRALADPETIPLIGVPGARERPYTLASVVAREVAIAESLARQIDRTDAPTVPAAGVEQAVAMVEASLDGGSLSEEQRRAVEAICTSGRGAELVVGVAGAGKTTMLRAVAAAFENSGYQVVGAATSGQAARTLGVEAEIGESRTLASLIWRLDHHQLVLDDHTVVVLDEVGMTDDIALARLAAYTEACRAKLVLVGDHRQLAAVGPGGALAALVNRHSDAVHRLVENRRQVDPEERQVLAELREGHVARAVDWYEQHDRIHPVADRDAAIQSTVNGWAADIAAGRQSAMYAWKRVNVAALNQAARDWMERTRRLQGPEVVVPGGHAYRAGDRVVALAPGPDRSLVTSERAVVEVVDPGARSLTVKTEDGRTVTLAGDQAGAERLGYGYATTVHRSQGATVDRAHLYADGGGRELAYVALSRARQTTQVWTVADDTAQAVEDLRRDWETRRSPTWAIDLNPPQRQQARGSLSVYQRDQQARHIALLAAKQRLVRQTTSGIRGPDHTDTVVAARTQLRHALGARADLEHGTGIYHQSEAGQAVRDLQTARARRQQAEHDTRSAPRLRDRRAATKNHAIWIEREADALARHQLYVTPEITRLDATIETRRAALHDLEVRQEQYEQGGQAVADLATSSRREASRLSTHLTMHRDDVDGVPQPPALRASRTPHLLLVSPPTPEPPTPQPRQLGIGM